jgi:hypothetical protein
MGLLKQTLRFPRRKRLGWRKVFKLRHYPRMMSLDMMFFLGVDTSGILKYPFRLFGFEVFAHPPGAADGRLNESK